MLCWFWWSSWPTIPEHTSISLALTVTKCISIPGEQGACNPSNFHKSLTIPWNFDLTLGKSERERESFTLQNETDNATLYRVIQIIQSWGSSLNFFNHWPKSNNFIWWQVCSEYEMLVPTYQFPSECWYWHIWLFQWGFYFLCMVYADVFLGLCTSWLVQSQWCTQDSPSFQVPSKSCLAWYPGGWNFYNEHTLFCWSKTNRIDQIN